MTKSCILKRTKTLSLILFLMIMIMSACTKKDNLTGDNWSGIRPITIVDSLFTQGFSFPAEGSVKGTEAIMLCGNYGGRDAISVMRFTGLPTEINTVEDATLQLVVLRRSPYSRGPISIDLFKLNKNWAVDSTAVISDADISTTPLNPVSISVPDTVATAGDTLSFVIPASQILAWQTEDVTGFNIVARTSDSGFVEFRTIESGYGPLLTFSYRKVGETSDRTYNQRAILDSYRVNAPVAGLTDNTFFLQSISPSRMYLKFELNETRFVDNEGNVLTPLQYKRCTINKAELVLYIKNNPYYNGINYSIFPYNVIRDSISTPIALVDSDVETISYSVASTGLISGDSIVVNITPIVQAITSGDRENKGVMLKSLHEMVNFGELEFWHFLDPALPANFEPKIRITYTPPYL